MRRWPRMGRRGMSGCGSSLVDGFEPRIRALLAEFPSMPSTVIAERIGWTNSSSVLRARVARLRALYAPTDPADRTVYAAGEIVQCDLGFPGKVIPVDLPGGAAGRDGWWPGQPGARNWSSLWMASTATGPTSRSSRARTGLDEVRVARDARCRKRVRRM